MAGKRPLGPGSMTIDGERYATDTFEYDGTTYTLRELSVDEGDEIWDAAQSPVDPSKPDGAMKFNSRFNSRALLARSLVEPTATVEQIGKWGGKKYVSLMRHFDRLNNVSEENPTPAAGSAAPTSPVGGDVSPAT